MWGRRDIIGAGLAAPALLLLPRRLAAATPGYPFTLGIASGEPTADGFVLWTRLAPDPFAADGGMAARRVPVGWELAEDEGFTRIVRRGTAMADPAWAHAVHVELSGLAPGRTYWYRFHAGSEASPIGRTRTAPAGGSMDAARVCFASCQHFETGYYAAYRHMAEEQPDLILFLGDYIYEADPNARVRKHVNLEPKDLAGYRIRYAQYKTDPLLQAAHASAPWATTWDDHEVANDYDNNLDENNSDPVVFLKRRAAAYRAYYEHLPLRHAQRPDGAALRLYRTLDWGALAQFQIIDSRQYRAPRACQPPELLAEHKKYLALVPDCPELHSAGRTMLGATQERWLNDRFVASRARWNVLTQQTIMSTLNRVNPKDENGPPVYSTDVWAGYPAARDAILHGWAGTKLSNPFAIGGDIHSFEAADMRLRPDGPPVGAEFVGGSITSLQNDLYLKEEAPRSGVRFAEHRVRGYGRIDIAADRCDVTFRNTIDATKIDTGINDLVKFTMVPGRPGITEQV